MKTSIFLTFLGIAFFFACQSGNEMSQDAAKQSFRIEKTLAGLAPTAQTFQVEANKGTELKAADGSKILIAAGTFVNAEGKSVNAKVSYTTYHGASDIISSGIPMQANNNGQIGQFISDGMFKIEATADGQPVQIAEGKDIQVFQPSTDTKSDFQMWYFNESKGIWEELSKREELYDNKEIAAVAQEMEVPLAAEIKEEKTAPLPEAPVAYNPEKMVLDLNFDAAKYPELSSFSRIMWQFSGTNPAQDPAKNKWIFDNEWSNTELKKMDGNNLDYELVIQTGNQTFETVVSPALTGKDLEKAKAKYTQLLANAENEKKAVEDTKKTAEVNEQLYNSFAVSKMGIFNCDRFYSDPQAQQFTTTSELDRKAMPAGQTIYVLTDNKKNVMQFSSEGSMRIKADIIDGIITVAAGGALATASAESLQELKTKRGGKIKLVFEKLKGKTTSLQDAIYGM